jgi:hypothetical protein
VTHSLEVAAEAKLVDVKWEKVCIEEKQECVSPAYGAPASYGSGYGASAYCPEKIKVQYLLQKISKSLSKILKCWVPVIYPDLILYYFICSNKP